MMYLVSDWPDRCIWVLSVWSVDDDELESLCWHPLRFSVSAGLFLSHRALGPADVRMVVLDISLPTGFTPENSDLEMVISLFREGKKRKSEILQQWRLL